jgi:hypothetical protein
LHSKTEKENTQRWQLIAGQDKRGCNAKVKASKRKRKKKTFFTFS